MCSGFCWKQSYLESVALTLLHLAFLKKTII
uniref:Uncharacterized protein n=1 Tax=Anguilla anguilla TaxID=7936 RepID=A0A0E9P7N0_ANGAN